MNIGLIKNIAKIHPATARFLELIFWAALAYVGTAIVEQEVWSLHGIVVAVATSVLPAISKRKRDLETKIK